VRPLIAVAAAVLVMAARTGHHPGLAWYALALFAVTVAVGALGRGESDDGTDAAAEPSAVDALG
jgi:hypothetical protein